MSEQQGISQYISCWQHYPVYGFSAELVKNLSHPWLVAWLVALLLSPSFFLIKLHCFFSHTWPTRRWNKGGSEGLSQPLLGFPQILIIQFVFVVWLHTSMLTYHFLKIRNALKSAFTNRVLQQSLLRRSIFPQHIHSPRAKVCIYTTADKCSHY